MDAQLKSAEEELLKNDFYSVEELNAEVKYFCIKNAIPENRNGYVVVIERHRWDKIFESLSPIHRLSKVSVPLDNFVIFGAIPVVAGDSDELVVEYPWFWKVNEAAEQMTIPTEQKIADWTAGKYEAGTLNATMDDVVEEAMDKCQVKKSRRPHVARVVNEALSIIIERADKGV